MADARTAILITLDPEHEGGFQKNPHDRANWSSGIIGQGTLIGTNGGITALDMPGVDIEHLTVDQKVQFYLDGYWKPLYYQITSQAIANKLFDLGVLFGIGTAVQNLQACIYAKADGTFGPVSLNMLNAADPKLTLFKFKTDMKAHAHDVAVKKPEEAIFLPGWLNRIDS